MNPTPTATAIAAELSALGPDEVMAFLVPHQAQGDRARALDHHGAVLAELRAAGWELATGVKHTPTGDAFWLAVIARPPKE